MFTVHCCKGREPYPLHALDCGVKSQCLCLLIQKHVGMSISHCRCLNFLFAVASLHTWTSFELS